MLRYLFLILFFADSAVHLYGCIAGKGKICSITKPALMPLLAAYYLSSVFPNISPFLLCALAASWIGDVLLILPGQKYFIAGGVFFALAHALFIPAYLGNISPEAVSCAAVIPAAAVYCAAAGTVIFLIRDGADRIMLPALLVYLLTNAAMNVFALMQLLSAPGPGGIAVFSGALMFFVSDCILFILCFGKNQRKNALNFAVMLTYIFGQFLIAHGMAMI